MLGRRVLVEKDRVVGQVVDGRKEEGSVEVVEQMVAEVAVEAALKVELRFEGAVVVAEGNLELAEVSKGELSKRELLPVKRSAGPGSMLPLLPLLNSNFAICKGTSSRRDMCICFCLLL